MEVGDGVHKSSEHDGFVRDIEFIKDDIKVMEKLHKKLQDSNEQSKSINGLTTMKELRASMDVDVDHAVQLAKAIIRRLEGLERSDAADPKISRAGSAIDRTRMTLVMGLGKRVRDIMDDFQGLRVKIAAVHKEVVEFRYYAITGDKQYVETIESLVSSREIEAFLAEAVEEQGSGRVLGVVQEIQERRDSVKHIQKCLIDLHQTLLDAVAMVEAQSQKLGAIENRMGGTENSFVRPAVVQLQQAEDTEEDARNRATIALILIVVLLLVLILPLLNLDEDDGRE